MSLEKIAKLITVLDSRRWETQKEAIFELKKIGAPAVEPLISLLNHKSRHVRKGAVIALGEIRDPRAVEPLTEALTDKDYIVRRRAVRSLGGINDDRVSAAVISALNDKNWKVRGKAAEVLGGMGDPLAIEPLKKMLGERNDYVISNVVKALIRLGAADVDPDAIAMDRDLYQWGRNFIILGILDLFFMVTEFSFPAMPIAGLVFIITGAMSLKIRNKWMFMFPGAGAIAIAFTGILLKSKGAKWLFLFSIVLVMIGSEKFRLYDSKKRRTDDENKK